MSRFPYDSAARPSWRCSSRSRAGEKVPARNVTEPSLPLHYPTINVVHLLAATSEC